MEKSQCMKDKDFDIFKTHEEREVVARWIANLGGTPHTRLEALKLALQIALECKHFSMSYKNSDMFFEQLESVYKIADRNLNYILCGSEYGTVAD